jgi:hypothetical protein
LSGHISCFQVDDDFDDMGGLVVGTFGGPAWLPERGLDDVAGFDEYGSEEGLDDVGGFNLADDLVMGGFDTGCVSTETEVFVTGDG